VRWIGRRIAGRFLRDYQRSSGVVIDQAELAWHQVVLCLRALVEMSGWTHAGQEGSHGDHPWLASGSAFAARLTAATGVAVRWR
jgi:hypothetical protein